MTFNPDALEFSRFLQDVIAEFYRQVYRAAEGERVEVGNVFRFDNRRVSMSLRVLPLAGEWHPSIPSWTPIAEVEAGRQTGPRLTQLDSTVQGVLDFSLTTGTTPQEGA